MRDLEKLAVNCENLKFGKYFSRDFVFDRPLYNPTEPQGEGTSFLHLYRYVPPIRVIILGLVIKNVWDIQLQSVSGMGCTKK